MDDATQSAPRYDDIVESLRRDTDAGRTTLRLEGTGDFAIVAESVADGVPRLRDGAVGDIRGAATFVALERDQTTLVQEDLANADPPPPPALVAAYGARAQVLAPLVRDGHVVGIVSVHETRGPRRWTDADVAAAETAAAAALERLDA